MSLINGSTISRVALYIRVSTEEQALEGWSVDAQERVLREFCMGKNWQIAQVYKDEGRTGTNTNRPGFQSMLRDARDGKFDAIVVHKLDRFSRNLVDVLMTLDDLQKKGVSFVSATEAMLDFTTQIGRFILLVLAFFAQWYVENLSAETTKGKKERFEQGLYNGDLRFGYSKGENGKPVPNADAVGVRLAYEWCAQGKTDAEIATLLNAAGYHTYRLIENNKKKASPDDDPKLRRPWTKDSVASLMRAGQFYLGNTEYVGVGERKKLSRAKQRGEQYVLQTQLKVGTHPAIITQEMNHKAIAARKERVNPGRLSTPQVPRTYLLGGGLAHCAACGDPLRCTKSQMGERYLYYRCTADWRGETCASRQLQVREQYLIPQLDQMIEQLMLPEDWRECVQKLLKTDDGSLRQERVQRAKFLKEELRRLSFQHQNGLLTDDEFLKMAAPTKMELAQLDKQVAARMPEHVVLAGEQMITIRASWAKAIKEQKRDMLHLMLKAVYIDTDNRCIVSYEPQPEFELLFRQTTMQQMGSRFVLIQQKEHERE